MAKIYYVTENAPDGAHVNFFKTEKEALEYGISEVPNFKMGNEPMNDEEADGEEWYQGDSLTFKKGILFSYEDAEVYVQEMDEDEAREYVEEEVGEYGSAIFFDGFKRGMYGYLGSAAAGKDYKWDWDGASINESKSNSGLRYVKLFEQFVNEASGKLTRVQIKKIEEWKNSEDRIWYGNTYNFLLKNASKIANAKTPDDVLKFASRIGGSNRVEVGFQGKLIKTPNNGRQSVYSYEDLRKNLKGVDTSDMGEWNWHNGIDFKVALGAYPSYKGDSCGIAYITFVYNGIEDSLKVVQFGVKGGFSCMSTVKTPVSSKEEIPGMLFMHTSGKVKSKKELEEDHANFRYWGISTEQTWDEIESVLTDYLSK